MDLESLSEVQEFYKGSTIFVTGGTGFLGHLLLAKLLRCCPGIKTIYVLVREKKSVSPEQRFQQLFSEQILSKVKEECPHYQNIVKLMVGDCMEPNLALSENDIALLEKEVEIIFHVAATINFTAPLKEAVPLNIACTENLLIIATNMEKLKVFLHVSTAYSNFVGNDELDEKFYDVPIRPEKIITMVNELDANTVSEIQPKLLGQFPNTYVYTKTIGEAVCQKYWSSLPVMMFRPAIVFSIYKDPIPGYINSIHGPIGLFAAASLGILRSLLVNSDCYANIVPCDYVINGMIVSAHATAIGLKNYKDGNASEPARIYNFGTNSTRKCITWQHFMDKFEAANAKFPPSKAIRTYSCVLNQSIFMHRAYIFLFHILPSLVSTFSDKMLGKQSRTLYHYQKLHKLIDTLYPFVIVNFFTKITNTDKLWETLSKRDKTIFNFDLNTIDWDEYMKEFALGSRLYVLKDNMETVPEARKKAFRLKVWSRLYTLLVTMGFLYIIYAVTALLKP